MTHPYCSAEDIQLLIDEAYRIRIHNLNKSIELAKQALSHSREYNYPQLTAKSLNNLSLFYMISGQHRQSIKLAKEAIELYEQLQDEKGVASAKYNIAGVYYKTDHYHLALIYLIDSLIIFKKYQDYHNQARTEKSLGTIYEFIGDIKSAIRSYQNSIDAAKKVKDNNLISNAYNPLSGIYLKQGDITKASELIERSIRLKTESGDIRGLAFALYGRAKIYIRTGEFTKAEEDLSEALKIHLDAKEALGTGMAYYRKAVLYKAMGRLADAKIEALEAINYSTKLNTTFIIIKCNYLLYEIYKQENAPVVALTYLEKFLQQKEAVINTQTVKVIENYDLKIKMEALEREARMQRERDEMMEKKEIAEKTAKMKQDFLSTMSHEIRTPLNAVISISSMLKQSSNQADRELIDSLQFASDNLLNIINDILDFTKLDAGKVQLRMRPFEFSELMRRIVLTYEKMAVEKGLKPELHIDRNIWSWYEMDDTKLMQILGNLISNAIKYTDTGSVKLNIKKIDGDEYRDTLRFMVSDTGLGIPADYFGKLFDSFSQPESITTRKQGGTGLGLAIVKRLIELHQSEIFVKSELGKGSVFYFDLRLKRALPEQKDNIQTHNKIQSQHILLAEDNMINAMVAKKLLSNWGITSEHAKTGLEAVELSMTKCFDLILMDIHMPEMNGFDAAAHIRNQRNPNSQTPIYALTADITAEQQSEYVNYFNGFLRKPIEIDKLQKALLGA
ncbi:tetratricopeptide repeat protein [Mucilaginibacter sp. RS28]|uniref:histidine kinase n=1 Tax=Mucilaginibacter straminoryzae TaxID=2932774 RepID=A0A9X1X1L2_9SPHI|nr:tetratricopeptide repeat protein [Mucilaginibacter straminoryzae]MCJ8209517.1 tetratricopeptide repeat protein [Mucilaginibacter straminoryzae]